MIIILLVILSISIYSKETDVKGNTDSLYSVLENSSKQYKFDVIVSLGNHYLEVDERDSALKYYYLAIENISNGNDSFDGSLNDSLAYIYNSIGVIYTNSEEYEEARECFEKSLKISLSNNLEEQILKCYENLSYTHENLLNYTETIKYCLKVDSIYSSLDSPSDRAYNLAYLGIIYNYSSDHINSLNRFHQALLIFEDIKDTNGITTCLGNIGIIYDNQEDYDKALEFYKKAKKYCKLDGDRLGEAINTTNIASIYASKEKIELATKYFEEAFQIYQEVGDKEGIAGSIGNLGVMYEDSDETLKAMESYHKALGLCREIGDVEGISINLGNIGSGYLNIVQGENLINETDKKEYINRYGDISVDRAIMYLEESLEIVDDLGYLESRILYLEALAQAYRLKGDFEKEATCLTEYIELKDSLFNINKSRNLASLSAQRDKIEKEKEIAVLEEKERSQVKEKLIIYYSSAAGFLLISIFLIIIYIRLKKEKKLSSELDSKNSVIEDANIELETQQKELEENHYELVEKNEEILASIRYAKTIQSAMLPFSNTLEKYLTNYFLIFKPKDIVSGDFYWFKPVNDGYLIAVADCTGHGVPGSMLSMMGNSILDEAVLSQNLINTGEILSYLNSKMIEGLNKQMSGNTSRDGMDICLIKIQQESTPENENNNPNKKRKSAKLEFSGAKRPLFLVRNNIVQTVKGDRNSIAGEKYLDNDYQFSSIYFDLETDTKLILTSDGFVDQIGTNGKKFGTKRFKQIISEEMSINKLHNKLETEFTSHIGTEDQRDDLTVFGLQF